VNWYQRGKTNLDFTEARDSEWQWHQLGRMQVCTSLQTDNHASTLPLSFFTGRMPFLSPNQQHQTTSTTTVYISRWSGEEAGGDGEDGWQLQESDGAHASTAESFLQPLAGSQR